MVRLRTIITNNGDHRPGSHPDPSVGLWGA